MLRLFHGTTLALALWSITSAADPTPEKIRFPTQQQFAPNPSPIGTLTADRLYIIDSDVPLLVLASPEGLVSVVEEAGPLRIRGKFIDGNGKTETRNYKGKAVFSIEAVATGRVELLIVPAGATKSSDVIRKTIDVKAGDAPQPPPGPDPPPDPPGPKASHVWVIIVEETSARTPEAIRIIGDATYWKTILDRGHKFRFYDVNSPEAKASGYADKAKTVGLPALIVVDQATGKTLKAVKLPADATGIDDIVKEVTK